MADLGKVLPVFGLLDHALKSGCLLDFLPFSSISVKSRAYCDIKR